MSTQAASSSAARKLWRLLSPAHRRTALTLMGLMLIGMALETLSTSLVMPTLGILTAQDVEARYPVLAPILALFGQPTQRQVVVGVMVALVLVFTIKASFLAFLAWRQARFAFGLQADLSARLFTGYLRQPWTFHLQRNSAQLIRNATVEVSLFTTVIISIMLVLTEGLVTLGVAALLVFAEPLGALVVISSLLGAAWVFYRFTRKHLLRWGEMRQHHEGQRIQHLQQGLGGAKDVKLLGREALLLERYSLHNSASADAQQHLSTVTQLPRLWLELLAATGLAILVLVMIGTGRPVALLLPIIGLFVVAAFRLMPSISRVMTSTQVIRYNRPVITTLHDEVAVLEHATAPRGPRLNLSFGTALVLENVSFRYEAAHAVALMDINLRIERGTSVGFVGESGAGKSTLVDVLLGLLTPTGGRVTVDGVDIQANLRAWQDQVGYVPQSIFLIDDTLRHNVAFGVPESEIDNGAVDRAIQASQLSDFVSGLSLRLETVVGERGVRLSGGQRQRLGIARALYHDPSVLVLDEATSSLDTANEQGVMAAVNALHGRKTIIIVAHRISTVAVCDRLYRLDRGMIVSQGSFDEVVKTDVDVPEDAHAAARLRRA